MCSDSECTISKLAVSTKLSSFMNIQILKKYLTLDWFEYRKVELVQISNLQFGRTTEGQ